MDFHSISLNRAAVIVYKQSEFMLKSNSCAVCFIPKETIYLLVLNPTVWCLLLENAPDWKVSVCAVNLRNLWFFCWAQMPQKHGWPHLSVCMYLFNHTHFRFECTQQSWGGAAMDFVRVWWSYIAVVAFGSLQRRPVFDLVGGRVEVEW